jgi:hypothetical protein
MLTIGVVMRKIVLGVLFTLFTTAAFAQVPQANMPTSQRSVILAFQQLTLSMDQMMAEMAKLSAEAKKFEDLDAYLKACKDKPGCTVPVEPAKP